MKRKTKKLCCIVNPRQGTRLKGDRCAECLIRSRQSYKNFKEMVPYISSVAGALYMIWQTVDSKYGWRSATNAGKVRESIKLLVEDMKLNQMKLEAK